MGQRGIQDAASRRGSFIDFTFARVVTRHVGTSGARNFQSTFRFRGVLIACGTIGLANGARITGDSCAEGVVVSIIMVLARGNAAIVARITLARCSLTMRSGE